MKTRNLVLAIAASAFVIGFSSCKKTDSSSTDTSTEVKLQSDDQARFSNETDAVDNDVNNVLENKGGSYNQRPTGITTPILPLPCDATITVDTVSTPRTITITYNGAVCFPGQHRTRTGAVVLSFSPGFRWGNAGAVLTTTFQNLKITRVSDNKSITINGARTVTNFSGGILRNLVSHGPIIHDIASSGMTVTFDNGTQRSWQISKRRVFSFDGGIIITTTGTGDAAGKAEWGTNRNGHAFVSSITPTQPLVVKQTWDFRLASGQVTHTGVASTVVTFGLDATGNALTAYPGLTAALYYKAVWTGPGGNSYTFIGPY